MKELGTGRSRGFGFVSYEAQADAATAIRKMQGYKIQGKRLKVEFKKGETTEEPKEKVPSADDERLIGYLRAISAQSVVQSLKSTEKESKFKPLPFEPSGAPVDPVDPDPVSVEDPPVSPAWKPPVRCARAPKPFHCDTFGSTFWKVAGAGAVSRVFVGHRACVGCFGVCRATGLFAWHHKTHHKVWHLREDSYDSLHHGKREAWRYELQRCHWIGIRETLKCLSNCSDGFFLICLKELCSHGTYGVYGTSIHQVQRFRRFPWLFVPSSFAGQRRIRTVSRHVRAVVSWLRLNWMTPATLVMYQDVLRTSSWT